MNYSTAIFLVNSAARAVLTSYEVGTEGKGVRPFTMYKTLDPNVKVGDYVVIPTGTRHAMTVARVEEVDAEVDFQSSVHVDWLVDKVDKTAFEAVLANEAAGIVAIKSAEKRKMQDELRAKLIADNPELAQLGALDGTAALPAPPAPAPFPGTEL